MNKWMIAIRSLKHYWRPNFAVVLGVAAATAVLTGALIVGESMRHSLRQLTLDRLGKVDELIVSDGFFREALADELSETDAFKAHYDKAIPLILFPNGTVEVSLDGKVRRANNVNVFAISDEFWGFDTESRDLKLSGYQVALNEQLWANLDGSSVQSESLADLSVTLRIPKPSQLPADSSLANTDDLVESFVDLEIKQIIPNQGLGRFGLQPSQTDAPNIYIPITLLQEALCQSSLKHKGDPSFANVILLAGKTGVAPTPEVSQQLKLAMRPSLSDFGMAIKQATQSFEDETVFDYFSLSSDRLVLSDSAKGVIGRAFPDSKPVFTYLANDIRKGTEKSGVPFSMVASIDFDKAFRLESIDGKEIPTLKPNEIVLNEWTANDLDAKIGDEIVIEYFEPESTHGKQTARQAKFVLAAIAKLTEPLEPFQIRGRDKVIDAEFDEPPTRANDPDLTPAVPGVTDAESIEKWDLPFETADKLRGQDDDYWSNHRTTPKAFINLAAGQKLWNSRFGNVTSFQIPSANRTEDFVEKALLDQIVSDQTQLGFELIPVKRNGLAASSGSTPFDVLFLALSMFVIGAALILVSLLFRLGLQTRANEVGMMEATGFTHASILGIWLREMLFVCAAGALLGVAMGIGYAALIILGLKTWWLGAISNPIIELHVGPISLIVGLVSGVVICILTIWWSLRRMRNQPVSGLLAGQLESGTLVSRAQKKKWNWVAYGLLVGAIGLSFLATTLAGDAQAGAFMGSGFFVLIALLMLLLNWLRKSTVQSPELSLGRLALISAKRNPLRSTLTIGLVAVASFLIVAVSSFRLAPTESGTAGFDTLAESSQPVFADLNSPDGQAELLGRDNLLPNGTGVFSFRLKPGQDASCNNLYQSTQPRVLGVSQSFIKRFDDAETVPFAFGAVETETESEKSNPWQLLNRTTDDGAIPVLIDKNTANYSLKIFATGGDYEVTYDSGETVKFRVVGFLSNTILQGSLIIAEDNFTKAFPYLGGYRYFLIDSGDQTDAVAQTLENRLGDSGFDTQDAGQVLSGFMKVQNNYLSAFQSLGALGLLLGTFGLASVQMRNVVERKSELGLMRAIGFSQNQLAKMVLSENTWLLGMGLLVGIVSALFATLPHFFVGSASMPWLQLVLMFCVIVVVGIGTGFWASRVIGRLPVLEALKR